MRDVAETLAVGGIISPQPITTDVRYLYYGDLRIGLGPVTPSLCGDFLSLCMWYGYATYQYVPSVAQVIHNSKPAFSFLF